MKIFLRKGCFFLVPLALMLSMSACQEEKEFNNSGINETGKQSLVFNVGSSEPVTKSGSRAIRPVVRDMIPISAEPGEDAVYLEESVISLDDVYYSEELQTKGTPIYTQNFGTKYPTFGASAYGYGNPATVDEAKAVDLAAFTGGGSTFTLTSGANSAPLTYEYGFNNDGWPKDGPDNLLFFLSAPAQSVSAPGHGVKSISYLYQSSTIKNNNNAASYNGIIKFEYETPAKAVDQTDILFTSKSVDKASYNNGVKENNSILFYHTLAGVKFKVGNAGDGLTTITSVELTGIKNHGTCTVTPVYDAEGYIANGSSNKNSDTKKSAAVSLWTNVGFQTGDNANADGKYTLSGLPTTTAGDSQFPESFYNDKTGENNYMDTAFANTFFFIPQETGSAKLTVTYTIANATGEHKVTVDFSHRKWEAGVLYTYTLTVKELGVSIEDSMGAKGSAHATKDSIKISNTRNTTEYIRVAVVGNWFDNHSEKGQLGDSRVIVNRTWKETNYNASGTLISVPFNKTYWNQGDDGFWYYKYPVKGGVMIPFSRTIFSSYTTPEAAKEGSHLQMSIAVQGVDATLTNADGSRKIPAAWAQGAGWFDDSFIEDGVSTPPSSTPAGL